MFAGEWVAGLGRVSRGSVPQGLRRLAPLPSGNASRRLFTDPGSGRAMTTGEQYTEDRGRIVGHETVIVDLEYTPWPTAIPALRAAVVGAFARAGLPDLREVTAPGGDDPLTPGLAWAPTTLAVRLVVEMNNADQQLAADAILWLRLRAACGVVRDTLPDLPLSLQVVTAQHKTSYAWRPDDTAADVAMAFDALIQSGRFDRSGVYGWYHALGQWQPI